MEREPYIHPCQPFELIMLAQSSLFSVDIPLEFRDDLEPAYDPFLGIHCWKYKKEAIEWGAQS